MNELRNQRLTTVIHRAVQGVIAKGLADPRLDECMITIITVKLSSDQRSAILGVSITPEKRERLALAALESASRHIRRRAADLVSIHKMPDLIFKLDRSFKRQAEVLSALNAVRVELGVEPGDPLPPPPPEDDTKEITEGTPADDQHESESADDTNPPRDQQEDAR